MQRGGGDGLHQHGRQNGPAGLRRRMVSSSKAVTSTAGGRPSPSSMRRRSSVCMPSSGRHAPVDEHQVVDIAAPLCCGLRQRTSARSPDSTASTRMSNWRRRSPRAAACFGQVRPPAARTAAGQPQAFGRHWPRAPRPSLAVNQKLLPTGRACFAAPHVTAHQLPPAGCVSARPRPVPPWRRLVELSTCSKALNKASSRSGGTPSPVSLTVKRTCSDAAPVGRRPALPGRRPRHRVATVRSSSSSADSAAPSRVLVNFTALATRFSKACDSRVGSPRRRVGQVVGVDDELQPLGAVRSRPTISNTRASSSSSEKLHAPPVPADRLRSSTGPGCR